MRLPLLVSVWPAFMWMRYGLADRKCYNLDGSVAAADVPCTSSETTNCCNSGDLCMSNGLCYIQGSRGSALSRGSCTDSNWGSKCFAPCSNYNRQSGFPVIVLSFSGETSRYCCGDTAINNGNLGCMNGDASFPLEPGAAILGVAGTATNSSQSSSDSPSSSTSNSTSCSSPAGATTVAHCPVSHDAAIGAGVGVPLGVVAVAALAWAIWERRQRRQSAYAGMPTAIGGVGGYDRKIQPQVMIDPGIQVNNRTPYYRQVSELAAP